ncbi:MAG: hypothetical protein RLZZ200_78 [Pseudomonadota bacterium]|jgi:DNA-binding response OmpR family regulator
MNRPRLLVVDDSAAFIQLLGKILEDRFDVVAARSASDALKLLGRNPVDLALIDIEMGSESGFQLLQSLRSLPQAAGLPVYFLSVHDNLNLIRTALDQGARDLIFKPVNPGLLRWRLGRLGSHGNDRPVGSLLLVSPKLEKSVTLAECLQQAGCSVVMASHLEQVPRMVASGDFDRVVVEDGFAPATLRKALGTFKALSRRDETSVQWFLLQKQHDEAAELDAYTMGFDRVIAASGTPAFLARRLLG